MQLNSNSSMIDNKIKVFKERFEKVRKESSMFHNKILQFEKSQADSIDYSKLLIKELEKKWLRIDDTISKHRLDFENYMNCTEKSRWEDKHKSETEKQEVTFPLFQKLETSIGDVSIKVHRQSDDQLAVNEKLSDLETKIILLIQAAKNSSEGKPTAHIFEGIGETISAVDHLKEQMKGQYAKLTEFKEVEKSVETLNNFYIEYKEEKIKDKKKNDELLEHVDDLKNSQDHLRNDMSHLKEERFKVFESQLIEKLDYNEFEITINNIIILIIYIIVLVLVLEGWYFIGP